MRFSRQADVWRAYALALRTPEDITPDEFACRYRVLHPIYCAENPGRWSSDIFPCHRGVMNAAQRAIEERKKGIVEIKAGQIGGTDGWINVIMFLKSRYPGPQLFITSTDNVAREFGQERFQLVIRDCPPVAAKYIKSTRGQILVKRFIDGPIRLCGGKSINNLQSFPYRFVVYDEIDSLQENLAGAGDPIKLGEVRTDSFKCETLLIAYAHPTTKDRGAGKLYYEESDQCRGFIKHKCGHEFWLNWFEVVKCHPRFPGQSQEQAARDPDCYRLYCPGCGEEIDEPERVAMLRAGVEQKSTLPPEIAKTKQWVGVHASQLYTPSKTIRSFAVRYIAALDNEAAMTVFVNKVLGDVYEPKVKSTTADELRLLRVVQRRQQDPEFYLRGTVPPAVLFLTGGQDSKQDSFHYTVWGWGIRKSIDGSPSLCGWLIDWAEIARAKSINFSEADYHIFNDLIYNRKFPAASGARTYQVRGCAHDLQYAPTQIPIIRYCRNNFKTRAFPARGAAETADSLAPAFRQTAARKHKVGDDEVIDEPAMAFNTYLLKTEWYGMLPQRIEIADPHGPQGTRIVPKISLPGDVDDLWIEQSKNEELKKNDDGVLQWMRNGANHLADCNTYAFGLALHFDVFARNLTAEEYNKRMDRPTPAPQRGNTGGWKRSDDPALG